MRPVRGGRGQDIARDLLACPAGRLRAMQGGRLAPGDAFERVEPDSLAAASIAQVGCVWAEVLTRTTPDFAVCPTLDS